MRRLFFSFIGIEGDKVNHSGETRSRRSALNLIVKERSIFLLQIQLQLKIIVIKELPTFYENIIALIKKLQLINVQLFGQVKIFFLDKSLQMDQEQMMENYP